MQGCLGCGGILVIGFVVLAIIAALTPDISTARSNYEDGDWEDAVEWAQKVEPEDEDFVEAQALVVAALKNWAEEAAEEEEWDEANRVLRDIPKESQDSAYGKLQRKVKVLAAAVERYVTTPSNIRRGPGTSYDALRVADKGEQLLLLGSGREDWSTVVRGGDAGVDTLGYIFSDLTSERRPTSPAPATARSSGSSGSRSTGRTRGSRLGNEVDMAAACKWHVKKLLVNPRSADFPWSHKIARVDGSNNRWVLQSYVDSKNRMGAEVRTHFVCEGEFYSGASVPETHVVLVN